MTLEEILLRRSSGQHLLVPAEPKTVVRDVCGLQAQFLSHALHALAIRSGTVCTDGLVKSWTIRGTMHLFCAEDLPLFLHEGRSHFLRPQDTLASDDYMSARRKAYFADLILDAVAQGIDQREALKARCEAAGMTERESQGLFDPWGGIIRALCEAGKLCHKVQEKKAYVLCPPFEPMDEASARLELAHRYFTHFGPATVKDAAYFFGATQTQVRAWLKQLPLRETEFRGRVYYDAGGPAPAGPLPRVLFLAGFDQLMLGYEKTESLLLPQERLREIFSLAGIVRPAVLLDGKVAGWWKKQNRKLSLHLFDSCGRAPVAAAAGVQWPELRDIAWI